MSREPELPRHISAFGLMGISLIILTCFTHNTKQGDAGSFFKNVLPHPWGKFFDQTSAWDSLKIMLLSVGLFLVIGSLASILSVTNHKKIARLIYWMQLVPGFGLLLGGYCLVKALF